MLASIAVQTMIHWLGLVPYNNSVVFFDWRLVQVKTSVLADKCE